MAESAALQIREPGKHALLNPETGSYESPKGGEQFSADHALVRAHRWAFGTAEQIAMAQNLAANVTESPIEHAPENRRIRNRK